MDAIRDKWNRRYREPSERRPGAEPNPLARRFAERVQGGRLLDAACGLGAGIAALLHRVDQALGVDLSEAALAAAREHWGPRPGLSWVQADVARLPWPADAFAVVCAFGFTDWDFLRQVPHMVRPGGLFLYQGFSRRQLEVKPGLDPAWTSTPELMTSLFPRWTILLSEESTEPPYRVSFAAERPADRLSE